MKKSTALRSFRNVLKTLQPVGRGSRKWRRVVWANLSKSNIELTFLFLCFASQAGGPCPLTRALFQDAAASGEAKKPYGTDVVCDKLPALETPPHTVTSAMTSGSLTPSPVGLQTAPRPHQSP